MDRIKTNTLVVGAGQAGVAMSEHLGKASIEHVVLERARIAERWRSQRWDSLVANGPAWHDRFPGMEIPSVEQDDFTPKELMADYFEKYAEMINAPIQCGVEVQSVARLPGSTNFEIQTSRGVYEAEHVVAATGPFQTPSIPPIVPQSVAVRQIHSSAYKNPTELPEGAVLVIGAGSSGVQIAEELLKAGRKTFLSVGPHDRPPRTYRGRDFSWWLGALGVWDVPAMEPGREHVTIAVCGAYGGQTVDYRRLAHDGMTLLGMTKDYSEGTLTFRPDLKESLDQGDANYRSILERADAYVEANGLKLPEDPEAWITPADPECVTSPVLGLDLQKEGISTILWATGFKSDYSWLPKGALNASGQPDHHRGVSPERGIYYLGLPWQTRRGSSFIWGVWHDAKFIADQIETQNKYRHRYSA